MSLLIKRTLMIPTFLKKSTSLYGMQTFRWISFDKLSNKRITRLESDIELESSACSRRLLNRNPRNLEQLSFEKKPTGFWLEKSPQTTWNKLMFEQSGRHLYAYLQHWSGRKLVEASTKELALKKYFENPSTIQAATVLAQVISRRCLQSGYIYAGSEEFDQEGQSSLKTKVFYETVEANGITLNEPQEITPRSVSDL